MNLSKLTKEQLIKELQKVNSEIADLEKTLELMPETTVLGRFSVKSFIKKKQKVKVSIRSELHSRFFN